MPTPADQVATIFQQHSRRVLATLIRLLRDFDLAEEALQDAFMAALVQWPKDGFPANPSAWLVSTGRFKAIDHLRRRARFNQSLVSLAVVLDEASCDSDNWDEAHIEDDQLRLIFTCCHPSLAPETQMALTLREICGLTTEEIARAFLLAPSAIAQRIVRAKQKIRAAGIPYEIPGAGELPARLEPVLQVIYLLYNEGYTASTGGLLQRRDLSSEAIRLGRLLYQLLPDPEVGGLLALMLVQDARSPARTGPDGELILLADQDRSLWRHDQIAEAAQLITWAFNQRAIGVYTVQAAIAAIHAQALTYEQTDWREIVGLYDLLLRLNPSPVIALNRAVAIALVEGPATALALVDELLAAGQLGDYHLAHAARADFLRQLGRFADARQAYTLALSQTQQNQEQRHLKKQLTALDQLLLAD